jgi:hypothetical protein
MLEEADAPAALDAILCTEELTRRPARPPEFEKENRALISLIQAMVDSPNDILQKLADTICEMLDCGSAGISLLTDDGGTRFYWPAISGVWKPHIGGGTPRKKNIRFQRQVEPGHPNITNLRILKISATLHAFKDPYRHTSAFDGDIQKAGST